MHTRRFAPHRRYAAALGALAGVLATLMVDFEAAAQADPFGDEPIDDEAAAPAEGEAAPEAEPAPEETPAAPEPTTSSAAEASEPAPAVEADASADVELGLGASATSSERVDSPAAGTSPQQPVAAPVYAGSHIRRPRLMVDDTLIIDSPLTTEIQGREYLQTRRQLAGVALPDTTAALGFSKGGGPGTSMLELRLQPTLVLLNGRRLVNAPYSRSNGRSYVDINQLPIALIDHVEFSKGLSAGLYGDGAIGGVANFVTKRDFDGIEVDLGGQATDKFDQHEEDVTLTLGAGSEEVGITAMVSYFNRQPLNAADRDFIHEREDRVETLLGSPGSFVIAGNNQKYPLPDPYCDLATAAGHANGTEVRLHGYGPPNTLHLLPQAEQDFLKMTYDGGSATTLMLPTANNGSIDELETNTYCTNDLTPLQDLVITEERLQAYSTMWHELGSHAEAYAEVGYYRNNNENRTAPSFPVIRITPDPNIVDPVWVPTAHADTPEQEPGFALVETAVPTGRVPANLFLVGRTIGSYAGNGNNIRRVDVMRGVLGVKGDFEGTSPGSVLDSWDWDISGVYSASEAISSVHDVLLDKLAAALNSCPPTKLVDRMPVPTTIKERQEMGCFNPFYTSVINNIAIDPLNVSNASVPNDHGFPTTDTDKPGDENFGLQDGGYICDPAVDPSQCPARFDVNMDGNFALAGTPNTKEVIDRIMGEQITIEKRVLGTVGGVLRGDIAQFARGGLSFGIGGEYRRESLNIDYDAAYNQRLYGFLFGADDVPDAARDIGAGYAELRLRLLDGLVELQPAGRIEYFSDVGTAANVLAGASIRPFAAMSAPPAALEWLMLRGHFGRGMLAPSLMQMNGSQTEFHSIEFNGSQLFLPFLIHGNPDLDFEKYTTISGGLQWDYAGVHVGADFWTTHIDDMVVAENAQTLIRDCQDLFDAGGTDCPEQTLLSMTRSLDHVEGSFGNYATVDTNGVDGAVSYTLDTKKRGMGDIGTFFLGVQGTYINSYLIESARALREFYRPRDASGEWKRPMQRPDGTRDYAGVSAEYEAAGWRNVENFAPPIPKLRFSVPLRWAYDIHGLGVTMRYIDTYSDDSEATVERYGLTDDLSRPENADGEVIDAWMVFDASYSLSFGDDDWKTKVTLGCINLLGTDPPAVESPLGYEVGVHDPRGRVLYARVTGEF